MMTITNEDNMAMMARYPDKYFDLAIVDPPYGLGKRTTDGGGSNSQIKFMQDIRRSNWDDSVPHKKYFDELFRVSKNQIIWGGNYFDLPPTRTIICWDKMVAIPSMSQIEIAWTSFDSPARLVKINNTDKNRFHPTQKPVGLYKWLLDNYATCKTCKNEGGFYEDVVGDGGSRMWQDCEDCYHEETNTNGIKILDTHLGSGSIAIACHDYGFDLTACELDPEYFEAAMKRINNHKLQSKLF